MNQSVSLRSFDHLADYCDCLSVMESIRKRSGQGLYEEIKNIFQRSKPLSTAKKLSNEPILT